MRKIVFIVNHLSVEIGMLAHWRDQQWGCYGRLLGPSTIAVSWATGHLPFLIRIPQGSGSVDFGSRFAERLDFRALVLFMSPFRAASDSGAAVRAHLISFISRFPPCYIQAVGDPNRWEKKKEKSKARWYFRESRALIKEWLIVSRIKSKAWGMAWVCHFHSTLQNITCVRQTGPSIYLLRVRWQSGCLPVTN